MPRALPLGRDPAADSIVDGADLGPLVVRAASVRGARHREDREHRRDTVHLRLVEGFGAPLLLSAVAAGEPDAPLSQSGSAAACRSLVIHLTAAAPRFGNALFEPGDDASVTSALRGVLSGVANSVRLVARANTAGVVTSGEDTQVATSLYGLLSQLGDRGERRHVVFGVGDARLLRLRAEDAPPGGPPPWPQDPSAWSQDPSAWLQAPPTSHQGTPPGIRTPRWTPLVAADPALAARRLPALAEDGSDLVWQRVTTRPGDVLVLASGPMADLLTHEDVTGWYARRWHGRQPFLTSFLSDVAADARDDGGDRSIACLWDHGHATALPT